MGQTSARLTTLSEGDDVGRGADEPPDQEDRARGFLRNVDVLDALEECARDGRALADELTRADEERLRETGEHIRRAAGYAEAARTEIRIADRTLFGGE